MILRKTMKHYQVPFKSYSTVKNVWKSVVGLEIHAQLNTKSKLFSGAQNTFGGLVNDCVSLFDASVPGTLPVLNRECVALGVKTALALSCKVNEVSTFDRKHYFYADLPSGYQITQQRAPLANDGILSFQVYNPGIHKAPYKKSSRIKQIQLEQDSGKSLHDAELKRSLVDLNRAGAPLVELVFEPDLEDGEEAAALVKELVLIVQRLGACTARMEEGALRVDANVSVHKDGDVFGTRTEIKNINTIRGVANAIKYEIERQMSVVRDGGVVTNETRSWDALNRVTVPMRDKETVQDYRYMPEPNLPPLRLNLRSKDETPDIISVPRIQETIPELPEDTRLRLIEKYNLKPESAIQIVNEPKLLEYFQNCNLSGVIDQQKIANLILNELLYVLNKFKIDPINSPITVAQINEMVGLLANKKINLDVAKKVFSKIIEDDLVDLPSKIVNKNKWFVDTNRENITKICMDVLNNNPKMVKQYKSGKVKVFKALLGTLAKNSQGKIDMAVASSVMEELLKNMK